MSLRFTELLWNTLEHHIIRKVNKTAHPYEWINVRGAWAHNTNTNSFNITAQTTILLFNIIQMNLKSRQYFYIINYFDL